MSKEVHTVGPWSWHPRFDADERNGSVYSEPSKGHAYAVAMQPCYVSNEQWEANARLIAAAPYMLGIIKQLDKWWSDEWPSGPVLDDGMVHLSDETIRLWQAIRAAIAKATGAAPGTASDTHGTAPSKPASVQP